MKDHGTNYFPTKGDAYKYYWALGFFSHDVDDKIKSKEVHIGHPPQSTKFVYVLTKDQGGSERYFAHTRTGLETVASRSEVKVYKVTGTDRSGRRFRMFYPNKSMALGINLWRGTVWEMQPAGNWKIIKRVYN